MTLLFRLSSSWLAVCGVAAAERHVGPVTDLQIVGGEIYSCSQAGVFRGAELVCRPGFRVLTFHVTPDRDLFMAGGEPGVSGRFAGWRREAGAIDFERKIADDLIYSMDFSSGQFRFALENGEIVEIVDESKVVAEHTAAARAVAISPDGALSASGGMDRSVILTSIENGDKPIVIQDHTEAVDCVVFSPDSQRLASGARDGKVRIHDREGKLIRTYSGLTGEVSALAWRGRQLLAGTTTGQLFRLSLSDDSFETITILDDHAAITALAIGQDGKIFVGAFGRVEVL